MENVKRKKSKGVAEKIFFGALFVILCVYVISLLFTLGWGVLTSLKSVADFEIKKNVLGLPSASLSADELKLGNYASLLSSFNFTLTNPFYRGAKLVIHSTKVTVWNTLLYTFAFTAVTAILNAFVPAIAAYMCAKYKFVSSKIIYTTNLVIMIIPIVGSYPSAIALLRSMGLYDTMIGYYIQNFNYSGMYFFVFYAFFESMTDAYSEAAEIDGASQYRVLFTIALPLAGKLLMTVWLLKFVAHWNDYSTILLYLPTKPTLAFVIYRSFLSTTNGEHPVGEITAGCMVLAAPLLVIFILFKDRLMGNLSLGGEKG